MSRAKPRRSPYAEDSLVFRVGMRIRRLRIERGVSLRALGKLAGVYPFHIMAIELGQLAANIKTLRSIAVALGVAPADLLNCDIEGNDLGRLVELMRKHPESVSKIKQRVASVASSARGCSSTATTPSRSNAIVTG